MLSFCWSPATIPVVRMAVCRMLTIAVFVTAFSPLGLAVQAIGTPNVSPNGVYVNESTAMTVVVQVAVDPKLIPTSVTLVEVNDLGQQVAVLGPMYDDGTHGDALPGDGKYTSQVTLNEFSSGSVGFLATVAFKGQLSRLKSAIAFVPVVVRPTDAQQQQAITVQANGAAFFANDRVQVGDSQGLIDLVAYLKGQPGVQDAIVSEDNTTVKIIFTSGLYAAILTAPLGTQ